MPKKLRLLYGINPGDIYVTQEDPDPLENTVTFHIANPKDSALVTFENSAGLTPADELPPFEAEDFEYDLSRFYIWFPWGGEPESLATEDDAKIITCSPDKNNGSWYCKRMYDTGLSIVLKTALADFKGMTVIRCRKTSFTPAIPMIIRRNIGGNKHARN